MIRRFRFLLDENLSPLTTEFLKQRGCDAVRITDHPQYSRDDRRIARLAIREKRVLITVDLDFGEIYHFSTNGRFGVWILRLSDLTVESVNNRLGSFLRSKVFQELNRSSMVILEDAKERIRTRKNSANRVV